METEKKELKTTDFLATIRYFKNILGLIVISAFAVIAILIVLLFKSYNKPDKEIYVVSDNGTFISKRDELGIRHEFEVANHIRSFLQLFYENDQHSFTKNMDAALNLIDKENGRKIYKGFNEKAYDFYVQNNAYSKVIVDSMRVYMNERPYRAKVYFNIVVYYAGNSKVVYNSAEMRVSENVRSSKNPFGLMIQNFVFLKYEIEADRSMEITDSLKADKLKEEQKRNYENTK